LIASYVQPAREIEENNQRLKEEERRRFKLREKKAVERMFVAQAQYRAKQEIRDEETQRYIEQRWGPTDGWRDSYSHPPHQPLPPPSP